LLILALGERFLSQTIALTNMIRQLQRGYIATNKATLLGPPIQDQVGRDN